MEVDDDHDQGYYKQIGGEGFPAGGFQQWITNVPPDASIDRVTSSIPDNYFGALEAVCLDCRAERPKYMPAYFIERFHRHCDPAQIAPYSRLAIRQQGDDDNE